MLESVANWIIYVISVLGYPGIFVTMAIESALIPLPSEVIMPFSGFLASLGKFDLNMVALMGALGNLAGSLVIYAVGYFGHEKLVRRFVRKFGKWLFISEKELDETEKLLHKYKYLVILGSRVVPGVRTVISLPCGFARLPLGRFVVLTFLGSLVWSYFLSWIGFTLGKNWYLIGPYFHKVDILVVGIIILAAGWFVYHKARH